MNKKIKFIVVGLLVAVSMVYLIVTGIQATGVKYFEIRDMKSASFDDPGESNRVKITGKVVKDSLNYDPHKPLIDFHAEGPDGADIRIQYEGIKPDAMREGGHVIVEGKYLPAKNLVRAHTLLAKCPSRYKSRFESYSEQKSTTS